MKPLLLQLLLFEKENLFSKRVSSIVIKISRIWCSYNIYFSTVRSLTKMGYECRKNSETTSIFVPNWSIHILCWSIFKIWLKSTYFIETIKFNYSTKEDDWWILCWKRSVNLILVINEWTLIVRLPNDGIPSYKSNSKSVNTIVSVTYYCSSKEGSKV